MVSAPAAELEAKWEQREQWYSKAVEVSPDPLPSVDIWTYLPPHVLLTSYSRMCTGCLYSTGIDKRLPSTVCLAVSDMSQMLTSTAAAAF